jgi:hypothetical protein
MVFKPTQGRQYYSREYGVIDISGQVAMAKAFQGLGENITQASFKVADKIADDNYNKAVRQAEADGKTNAVVRNPETNEIEPLVNLDYTKANDGFMTDAQREDVKRVWRDAAFQTYASSVGNDAVADATKVFIDNKTDPDAIRGALSGKLESLQGTLDPTLYALVEPKITSAYRAAENKAFANQQIATNERANVENVTALNHNVDQIGILSSALTGDNSKDAKLLDRISELREENEAIYEALEVHEYGIAEIQKLKVAEATRVADKVSTSIAEKIYYAPEGGLSAAVEAAHAAEDQFANSPDVDGEKIKQRMLAHISSLELIEKSKISESVKSDKAISGEAELRIRSDVSKISREEIMGMNISDDGIKASLINMYDSEVSAVQKTAKEKDKILKDAYKEVFDKNFNVFIDESLSQSQRDSASSFIESMYTNGLVEPAEWRTYVKSKNTIVKNSIKGMGRSVLANIDMQMSKASNYVTHPSVFAGMEKQLIAEKVIGEGRAITLDSWRSKVESYRNNWSIADKKRRDTMSAKTKAENGIDLGPKDQSLLVEASEVIFQKDPANESIFFHSDLDIREQNFQKAVQFTLSNKFVHPEMVSAMNSMYNSISDERSFDVSIQLFNKLYKSLFDSLSGKGTTGSPSLIVESMLTKSGINPSDYAIARTLSFKGWQDWIAGKSKVTNGGRIENSFKSVFGKDITTVINSNIGKAIEGSAVVETLLNNTFWESERDPRALFVIDQLLESGPQGKSFDETDIIINDARLSEYLRVAVPSIMIKSQYEFNEKNVQFATREAIVNIAGNLGINFDEDGTPSIGINTWYKQASASLGANAQIVPGGVEGSFFREIRRQALRPDVVLDQRIRDMIENDEGVIKVYPDEFYGAEQTYSVYIESEEGVNTKILSGFHYDYKKSLDYGVMQTAVNRVKNSTLKNFLSHAGVIKPSVLERVHQDILNDYNDDANLIGLNEPQKFIGAMELLTNALNAAKPVVGWLTGKSYVIDPKVDADDVKVLRAWLNGDFASEKLFNQALQESLSE